jgi:hypothetical protein
MIIQWKSALNVRHCLTFGANKTMQKLNLITAALSGGGLALLIIGAVENVFTSGECLIGGVACALALIYSLSGEA